MSRSSPSSTCDASRRRGGSALCTPRTATSVSVAPLVHAVGRRSHAARRRCRPAAGGDHDASRPPRARRRPRAAVARRVPSAHRAPLDACRPPTTQTHRAVALALQRRGGHGSRGGAAGGRGRARARRRVEEAHLDAHVGQDARVERVEGDAHPHRRLLAVGRRHDGDRRAPGCASRDRRRASPRTCWPSRTRLMNASLTSTSISSDSMSTMVAMPVRVKPPPAEIGETISPGCASLEITTPANGARTTWSSRSLLRAARPRAAATRQLRLRRRRAAPPAPAPRRGRIERGLGDQAACAQRALAVAASRRASASRTSISSSRASAASSCDGAPRFGQARVAASRRASTWSCAPRPPPRSAPRRCGR